MSQPRHPIQVVARRTGLSADVLRAWEKRYGAVAPERSASRRRLYSDADIERLRLLKRLTGGGRSIGQIAARPTEDLAALVREDEAEAARVPRAGPERGAAADALAVVQAALQAVQALDAGALEAILARAMVALGAAELIDGVAAPLLGEVGRRWEAGELGIAHEHLASAVMRRFFGSLLASGGALLAAGSAAALGWQVTYLGPDLPAADIAAAAIQQHAQLVLLSIVCPAPGADIGGELAALQEELAGEATLVVGGEAAGRLEPAVAEAGAVRLGSFGALRSFLATVRTPFGQP